MPGIQLSDRSIVQQNTLAHSDVLPHISLCMNSSILSPKYQIVIPREIRKKLALKPGQRIQFAEKNGHVEIRPILTPDQLIGFLKGAEPLTLEREPDREF